MEKFNSVHPTEIIPGESIKNSFQQQVLFLMKTSDKLVEIFIRLLFPQLVEQELNQSAPVFIARGCFFEFHQNCSIDIQLFLNIEGTGGLRKLPFFKIVDFLVLPIESGKDLSTDIFPLNILCPSYNCHQMLVE